MEEDVLFFLRDENAYWDMRIIADKNAGGVNLKLDKDCVTAVVNRGEELSANNKALVSFIESCGFEFESRNLNYEIDVAKNIESIKAEVARITAEAKQYGLTVIPYEEKYRKDIHALWREYLNKNDIPVDDWEKHICNSPLVIDENGKLCGVHMLRIEGKKCTYWHCVIDPAYRGKKVGRLLTYIPMVMAYDRGFELTWSWIAEDNIASQKMAEGAGERRNGISSYRYVLECKD
ncbi:MAG: GNAT family N-acetyltransferase [Clostridia bacterium]|nr:GNAT family N-acetyltransferase [Clostridia bacterium]